MESSSLKWFKVWYKFKGEDSGQLSFDFTDEEDGWIGPFHHCGTDSESTIASCYNNEAKPKRYYKITGEFKHGS